MDNTQGEEFTARIQEVNKFKCSHKKCRLNKKKSSHFSKIVPNLHQVSLCHLKQDTRTF